MGDDIQLGRMRLTFGSVIVPVARSHDHMS